MTTNIRLLSLNVGMNGNLAGLRNMISDCTFDVILLQEVRLTEVEINSKLYNFGYKCKVNIDEENIYKPGTAILWRASLPIIDVVNLHQCRAQVAFLMNYAILNIYAPSGTNKRNERALFFSRDLFTLEHLKKRIG